MILALIDFMQNPSIVVINGIFNYTLNLICDSKYFAGESPSFHLTRIASESSPVNPQFLIVTDFLEMFW